MPTGCDEDGSECQRAPITSIGQLAEPMVRFGSATPTIYSRAAGQLP
jgi:hypothetical protein